uniref:Uncharacterized protein n=1 Tax=Anguilla anguilla TaxID=7936 RepID=A0A0E9QNB7_ANGAN
MFAFILSIFFLTDIELYYNNGIQLVKFPYLKSA